MTTDEGILFQACSISIMSFLWNYLMQHKLKESINSKDKVLKKKNRM